MPSTAAAGIEVVVEGLAGELRDAVLATLEIRQYAERDATPARARYLYSRGESQIREALEPFGYYGARVTGELEPRGPGEWRATYRVDAGPPVLVQRVDVHARGVGAEVPAVRRAIDAFPLATGERLDHAEYESGKQAIATALRGAGFLDAEMLVHRVAVNTETRSADVDLEWDVGPRYRLGPARFAPDAQFPPEFLQGYVPWQPGDWYATERLLTLQERLVDADYFGSVGVQPALDERRDGMVPVDVRLRPAPRNVYSAGVFFSTDFGVGGRLAYDRRWLNRRGHKLETRFEYSQRLEEYAVTYRIPRPGPASRDHAFGVAYRNEISDTVESRSMRVAATETREQWRGFTRTLGLHFLRGDYEIGGLRGRSTLLYAQGSVGRLRYDDYGFPREGHSVDLGLRAAPGGFVSDTGLLQAWATGRRLVRSGERNRFVFHARLGAMAVGDFGDLPPELRFFAGGDRSLRGFEHQAIGETDARGEVIGGKYLAVGSAEYEHYFREAWGAAVFVDAGDAFSRRFDVNVAAGVGARWRSPVGMVRLDVAKPVKTRFDDGLRIHVTIGADL